MKSKLLFVMLVGIPCRSAVVVAREFSLARQTRLAVRP